MKRIDRYALEALGGPFPGALAGVTAVALFVGLRRLVDRAPLDGLGLSALLSLLGDLALSASPLILPLAVGVATALGAARLRRDAELRGWAAAGVGPLRVLAAPFVLAVAVGAVTGAAAHGAAPAALRRISAAVQQHPLAMGSRQIAEGAPRVLAEGPAGAAFVVAPGRIAWLADDGSAGMADVHRLDPGPPRAAELRSGVAWLQAGTSTARVSFDSARVTLPAPGAEVSPWAKKPGRAWRSDRLRAAAQDEAYAVEARARWRRLLAERWAAPALVLAHFLWAAGAVWGFRRPVAPAVAAASGAAAQYVLAGLAARAAVQLPDPIDAAHLADWGAAGWAPLVMAAVGATLLSRRATRS